MSSVQERLQIKREPLDQWSIREKLCLASAVARSGDQNWMSVSRAIKPFGEPNRPPDWFHQKNCAAQYGSLLENVETPKRKKRTGTTDTYVETPSEIILKKLTKERLAELDRIIAEEKVDYQKLDGGMKLLESGNVTEEQLDAWCKEIDEEERLQEEEFQAHNKWLKEREKRKQEIERAWRPYAKSTPGIDQKRKASDSTDTVADLEQINEDQPPPLLPTNQSPIPSQDNSRPALSPLLTSLLKSPSHSQNVATSILHSAITSQSNSRNSSTVSNPTIASLLNSNACVSISPGIQHLVSSAISQTPTTSHNNVDTNPVEILEETVDTLPNIKVEDIESTILSSTEPLLEIKNEEVDVIISDLIQNADIVENPEQHLQLDDNEDIITNLENELHELCAKEEADRVAAENADRAATEKASSNIINAPTVKIELETSEIIETSVPDSSTIQILQESSSNETPISSETVQGDSEMSLTSSVELADILDKTVNTIKQKPKEDNGENEKCNTVEKESDGQIDPFEFREEVEITEALKPASFSKHLEHRYSDIKDDEKRDSTFIYSETEQETKEIRKSIEEKINKDKHGSVEIVEVVEMNGDGIEKELNKKQIQDIVHSTKPPEKDILKVEKIEEGKKEEITKIISENFSEEEENDLEVELKNEDKSKKMEIKVEQEVSRDETYTPEFSASFLDDLEVNKLDKMGRAKRDYSRTKKKDDKDFDILLAVEKAVSSNLDDVEQTEDTCSENNFFECDKKKVKLESDRSNSPWTEEEELQNVKSRIRSSATATPVDSVPSSPASSSHLYEDDRDYRNWKKSVMLVYNRLATHKNASIFLKPITDEQAPGYHSLIYRPMDLQTIRKNIETGVIKTTSEFYRDVLLMFTNAIMFNKTGGTVYNMAKEMQQDSIQPIKVLMQAQQGLVPPKRETRTSESGNKRRRANDSENSRSKKRKDD